MNPLEKLGLRDIHLPAEPGWWPPAPGWWLLVLALLVAALVTWLLVRRHRRRRPLRRARAELRQLRRDCATGGRNADWLAQLSRLLRRVGLACNEPPRIAGLQGEDWLNWLDEPLGGDDFRRGPGQVLKQGPYRPEPRVEDAEALFQLCERWLDAMYRKRR